MRAIVLMLIVGVASAEDATFLAKHGTDTAEITARGTLKMTTAFGSANVLIDRIDELRADKSVTVLTSDGTTLRGTLDWSEVQLADESQEIVGDLQQIKSLSAIRRADPEPGRITIGRSANKLGYYFRAPDSYDSEQKWPTLVLLHGSNMNAKSYVESVVSKWPELADTHLLIGINGERRSSSSSPTFPRYNYTYVNFAGKSKFKGYPGTDRESPALVAELLTEFRERLPISRLYIIGHSQGGFLTYSVTMNYPELVDGAVPVSGGVIVQAVPTAYENAELIAQQKATPIAIVHGKTDRTVSYKLATAALQAFEKAEYPKVKLFDHETAGHGFMFLPIKDAVEWLDQQQ